MFGLFNKNKSIKVFDKIWLSENAKFKACLDLKQSNTNVVFLAWFEDTRQKLSIYFQENNLQDEVRLAHRYNQVASNQVLIFVEHHPLENEEQKIANQLGQKEITVYSSLTEPIFELFGGVKIIELMKKMGIQEFEAIENSMVTNSIKNAQKKIASKTVINSSTRSQGDWLLNAGFNFQSF